MDKDKATEFVGERVFRIIIEQERARERERERGGDGEWKWERDLTLVRAQMLFTAFGCGRWVLDSVWPDVKIKVAQIYPNVDPNSSHSRVCFKVMSFLKAQKVTKYLGYFCKKICYQELLKIAQSGHMVGLDNVTRNLQFDLLFKWK